MLQSITIGVPIRNEEKSLPIFIKNLEGAIGRLKLDYTDLSIEILFCINNTTDGSEDVLKDSLLFSKLEGHKTLHCNSPGKFSAIQKIAKSRKFEDGYICIIDADIILDQFCIVGLLRQLHEEKDIFLSYSSVFPVENTSINFMTEIQKTHYLVRNKVSPRKYFHGRTYMMRDASFLLKKARSQETNSWSLKDGPYVDDIYLSRAIVHEHGINSMKESKYSKLWFIPPQNLKDFYFGQRRLLFEIKRLDLLYPEHSYIQQKIFKKKIYWSYLLNSKTKLFFPYLLYFLVEETIKIIVRLEISLISLGLIKCKAIWKNLNSTKEY